MCGIAGILDPLTAPGLDSLRAMAATMVRRGPDDDGFLVDGPLGLAHRRLSIIDLSGGHQPILNEDESLAVVCNGEIYDFQAIRKGLEAKGHRFRTGSDSELLLHLYEEEGEAFLSRLNGMFAFAIADRKRYALLLGRDRFGKKPLFYACAGERFAFASGPSALRTLPWVDTTLDLEAVHDYLEFQYLPCPASIHRGIRKLPPGSMARWDGTALRIDRYWQPSLPGDSAVPFAEAARDLRTCLDAAVRRRLVADVPVGCFLSGGMDSSIIAALAAQAHPQVKTFSIGFPEKKYDERAHALRVARHIGSDHHFLEVDPSSFAALADIVDWYEEPFCDASMIPTTLLAAFTRRQVTVALSGDGADELFGGYERYVAMRLLHRLDILPAFLRRPAVAAMLHILPPKTEERTHLGRIRRFLDLLSHQGLERYRHLINRFPEKARRPFYGPALAEVAGRHRSLDFLESHGGLRTDLGADAAASLLDLKTYLPEDILVKVDRASMAHALEVRCPFLDPEVAALAMRLPFSFKQKGFSRKRILAAACADLLPEAIFARRKMGFGVPIARWLRGPWLKPARDVLLSGPLFERGLFHRQGLERLLAEHAAQQADHSYALFAILILALWLESARSRERQAFCM